MTRNDCGAETVTRHDELIVKRVRDRLTIGLHSDEQYRVVVHSTLVE